MRWADARAWGAALALAPAAACFHDVPIETSGSSGDPSTSEGSTTAAACGGIGEACTPAGGCCDPCGLCVSGTCQPSDALCGACAYCDAGGACKQVSQGSPCGAELDCKDYVFGVKDGACLAGAGTVRGVCSGGGKCIDPAPGSVCTTPGQALVSCGECLRDDHVCVAGLPAAEIMKEEICAIGQTTAKCGPTCEGSTAVQRICDEASTCVTMGEAACDPYGCVMSPEGPSCAMSCDAEVPCADGFSCVMAMCTM